MISFSGLCRPSICPLALTWSYLRRVSTRRCRVTTAHQLLVAADGTTILSQFGPGLEEQRADVSYGTQGNCGSGLAGYFLVPTPGAPNGVAVPGFVADTKFSPDRGFYSTE